MVLTAFGTQGSNGTGTNKKTSLTFSYFVSSLSLEGKYIGREMMHCVVTDHWLVTLHRTQQFCCQFSTDAVWLWHGSFIFQASFICHVSIHHMLCQLSAKMPRQDYAIPILVQKLSFIWYAYVILLSSCATVGKDVKGDVIIQKNRNIFLIRNWQPVQIRASAKCTFLLCL